jgi:transposase
MEIEDQGKKLKLWVRRKKAGLKLICSQCGQHVPGGTIHEVCEREVRDLPCFEYTTTVVVETYRVRCPRCGIRAEKVAQLPSKAPYSKRFEEAVGQASESAAARQVARRMGLAGSTVRAMDLRYLERWEARRRKPALRQMGVDELYRGKKGKFLTVVCNLETSEPLWFGRERKKETLDDFFRSQLVSRQRKRIEAACVDMWEPFRRSIEQWAPQCKIVYDKFHILQHANEAIDEVRRAEFFRQGKKKRDLIKGKKWLLMSRWTNLTSPQRGALNRLFQLNRRVFKAYLLKESLERLWNYRYEGAMLNYLQKWMDQLKWQRLTPVRKAGGHAAEAPGGNSELLPHESPLRGSRGGQWEHSHAYQPWPRL